MDDLFQPQGKPIEAAGLSTPRARSFVVALTDGSNDYARMIECRTSENVETVVFEVDVELGQLRKYPIRHRERLAALFARDDQSAPEVLSLRGDFPSVPHLNLKLDEFPRSLCLYDELFRDIKRTWTAPRFVERIRAWLALTANGALHQDDQPLEPLFFAAHHVIIPDDIFEEGRDLSDRLQIEPVRYPSGRIVCILKKAPATTSEKAKPSQAKKKKEEIPEYLATAFRCAPQSHGVIRKQPSTLRDLHEILDNAGTNLLNELRYRVNKWEVDEPTLNAKLFLIVSFPKSREAKGSVEATDVWTFLTTCTLRELGKEIGLWDLRGQERGRLLITDELKNGEGVRLELLHTHFSLTRRRAAVLNGHESRVDKKIVGVGAGALGSQVVLNLVRSGFGEWTLIDDDILFPHNLARHGLDGVAEGYPKAHSLACFANSLIDGKPIAESILADILEPGDASESIVACLTGADLVVDMSASVTVARHLACSDNFTSRRFSIFLNPTGEDLVVLAEDASRETQLDSIEMQYYRALASDSRLDGHFKPFDARRRYGQSCRDVTSDIPQDYVALHAANASRAIKSFSSTSAARIAIWRADSNGNVRRLDIGPAKAIRHVIGEWTVCTDALLVHRLAELREAKLPKETGGVLVGTFDLERRLVYIVDTIPSPPDSKEWPTLYIRGCQGLKASIDEIADKTDGMLEYIGEWHSHPTGCTTMPSTDDIQVFAWLTELMNVEGLPALMMIVGDLGHSRCFIGNMSRHDSLLPEGQL